MGSVFREIKGRIPPDSAFSSTPSSPSGRLGGNGMDIGGLCHPAVACAYPHLLHIPLWWPTPASADHCPLVDKPHRLLFPPSSHAFLRPEHVSLRPIFQGSAHTHLLCGLLRRLLSTDHPDNMMLTAVSTINLLCVCVILSHTLSCRNHRAVCNLSPTPPATHTGAAI